MRAPRPPLTKRLHRRARSARWAAGANVLREAAQDLAPSLTLKSLTVLSIEPASACWLSGQRHEGVERAGVFQLGRCSRGCREEPHADGLVPRAAEDALAVGHRRHRVDAVGVPASQVLTKALAGDAPRLEELSYAPPLMMCWPSGVTAKRTPPRCAPLEGVDERAIDVVQPDLAARCRPQSARRRRSAATARARAAHLEGALERAVERPQLRGAVGRAADEARSAWQHRHRRALVCAWTVRSHAPSRHTLTRPLRGHAGDDAAVGRHASPTGVPGERHDLARERPQRERELRSDAERMTRRRARCRGRALLVTAQRRWQHR